MTKISYCDSETVNEISIATHTFVKVRAFVLWELRVRIGNLIPSPQSPMSVFGDCE